MLPNTILPACALMLPSDGRIVQLINFLKNDVMVESMCVNMCVEEKKKKEKRNNIDARK